MASAQRFSYEWQQFPDILPVYEKQFLGWVSPLTPADFKNKTVLDAGCGIGRNLYWALKYGASKGVAFEHDQNIVTVARKNLSQLPNAIVRFGTIYDIPESNKFDLVLCIGVLPHLENPALALKQLVKACRKGGLVVVWVLGREGNDWIIKLSSVLRLVTSRLPLPLVFWLAFILTIPIYFATRLHLSSHPYWRQLATFTFSHIHSIMFDHLIPKIVHYFSQNEARALLINARLKKVIIKKVNNNSWTVIGKK